MLCVQPIDFDVFQLFMEIYLEAVVPDDLCKHLFLSFLKKSVGQAVSRSMIGRDGVIKDAAAVASQMACVPVIGRAAEAHQRHDSGSKEKHFGITEKLHGLTEKIHSLGHIRRAGEFRNICIEVEFHTFVEQVSSTHCRAGEFHTFIEQVSFTDSHSSLQVIA